MENKMTEERNPYPTLSLLHETWKVLIIHTIIFDCTLATGYGFIRCYPSFVQWVPSKFQTEICVLSKLCVTNCI